MSSMLYKNLAKMALEQVAPGIVADFLHKMAEGEIVAMRRTEAMEALQVMAINLSSGASLLEMAQDPDWLHQQITSQEQTPFQVYLAKLYRFMLNTGLTQQDLIKTFAQKQPELFPPEGSREKDLELGVTWQYIPGGYLTVTIGDVSFQVKGSSSDGRIEDSALTLREDNAQVQQLLAKLAILRQAPVYVAQTTESGGLVIVVDPAGR